MTRGFCRSGNSDNLIFLRFGSLTELSGSTGLTRLIGFCFDSLGAFEGPWDDSFEVDGCCGDAGVLRTAEPAIGVIDGRLFYGFPESN